MIIRLEDMINLRSYDELLTTLKYGELTECKKQLHSPKKWQNFSWRKAHLGRASVHKAATRNLQTFCEKFSKWSDIK